MTNEISLIIAYVLVSMFTAAFLAFGLWLLRPRHSEGQVKAMILDALSDGREQEGRDIRAALAVVGVRISGPAFYRLMAQLVDSEAVTLAVRRRRLGGMLVTRYCYRIKEVSTNDE